jgi:hypothetical protein
MILLQINGMDVNSELIRDAASEYPFDAQAVLYLPPFHGYRDAPNPTTQKIRDARDRIVAQLEQDYPVTIETFTAEEQDAIMRERFTNPETGEVNLPDWYDSP